MWRGTVEMIAGEGEDQFMSGWSMVDTTTALEKGGFRFAGPLSGVVTTGEDLANGHSVGSSVYHGALVGSFATAGAFGGEWVGGGAGALAGEAVLPVIGAPIGAAVGASVGGFAGSLGGAMVGNGVYHATSGVAQAAGSVTSGVSNTVQSLF
jgi:hypothetical protein